jgi:hypothetical protein
MFLILFIKLLGRLILIYLLQANVLKLNQDNLFLIFVKFIRLQFENSNILIQLEQFLM